MGKESFEDKDVAILLNKYFICIKVDREERPDIDSIYMKVCQMMTGSGGWPLTIIMTPNKKPFFAATYIPKESRFGRTGLMQLLPKAAELWKTNREELEKNANQIINELNNVPDNVYEGELDRNILAEAYSQLSTIFDEKHGGFGNAPKFPTPHNLTFLLRYWMLTGNGRSLYMIEKTLKKMRLGGIFDQVGFGFHRYSTDAKWFVPHFEKMLYDQALLAIAYTETFQVTLNDEYKESAEQIFDYVLRDMTDKCGGFYSAEDADSEGEEGKFYTWEIGEIEKLLSKDDAELFIKIFNLKEAGNYKDEAIGLSSGKNILFLEKPIHHFSTDFGMSKESFVERLKTLRHKLFCYREKRIHPQKDDKILTDWNALMIAALAKAARVFGNNKYKQAAVKATDFILSKMRDKNGKLFHRYRDGEAAIGAFLDDYSFLIFALIELYESTFEANYLKETIKLNKILLNYFWDDKNGGFFLTGADSSDIPIRKKDIYDGALPSGNSVAMLNMLRLSRLIGVSELEERVHEISKAFYKNIVQSPASCPQMMSALEFMFGPAFEVVIIGDSNSTDTKMMIDILTKNFLPNVVVLFIPSEVEEHEITNIAKFTKDMRTVDGKTTAYICRNFNCELPTTKIDEMIRFLHIKSG